MGLGLQNQPGLAHGVSLNDGIGLFLTFLVLAVAVENAPRREVGAFDVAAELFGIDVVDLVKTIDHVAECVDHFAEIVGRNVGGHAHGDTAGAVDEQIGQRSR